MGEDRVAVADVMKTACIETIATKRTIARICSKAGF